MSTNKTQHYHLHAWEPSDDFLRAEMNENFAAIDAAICRETGVLDGLIKAETAARTQAVENLNGRKAEVVAGTYTGDGRTSWRHIELGFQPVAVIIERPDCARTQNIFYGGMAVGQKAADAIAVDDTGFQVYQSSYDHMNSNGTVYLYLAFR